MKVKRKSIYEKYADTVEACIDNE